MADDDLIESLCIVLHDAYETAAAEAGWETQADSRKPWADVPEANRVTMRAAVRALLADLVDRELILPSYDTVKVGTDLWPGIVVDGQVMWPQDDPDIRAAVFASDPREDPRQAIADVLTALTEEIQ